MANFNDRQNLGSWKEIADFLGVSQRTAQKWEEERGLPVRRLSGAKGRVAADRAELERWKQTTLKKAAWYDNLKVLRYYAAVTTALILVATGVLIGIYLSANRRGPPSRYHLDFDSLVVSDSAGREVWRRAFKDPFWLPAYEQMLGLNRIWFGNLTGEGIQTLFMYYPTDRATDGTSLICFSKKGEEQWQFTPGRSVSDLKTQYSPVFLITDFHVSALRRNGKQKILVTSHHLYDHPNQFVVLGEDMKIEGEYWHSGHLQFLEICDAKGNGDAEILLAGVNNGYHSAVLVVLDPSNIRGASLQGEGDTFQLQGFPPGTEKALILFPRSCINKKIHADSHNRVDRLTVAPGRVEVDVAELENDPAARVIYTLDQNLSPIRVVVSDYFKRVHRVMEARRELDHPLTSSEIEAFNSIRVMKRINGKPVWQTLSVNPKAENSAK